MEDMSQYLGVFLEEADEQMLILERDILQLEQGASSELLQVIFRAAHTLKGSSRAMGFTPMGELTHAMEDVFDKLRHNELAVSRPLIDALFQGLDALKAMRDEIADNGATTLDTTVQTANLRVVLDGPSASPAANVVSSTSAPEAVQPAFKTVLSESELVALEEARAAGCAVFALTIQLASDCVMKSVRAFMSLQAIENVGAVLATTPGEDGIENETFDTEFEVIVATDQDEAALCAAIQSVNEVSGVRAVRWGEEQGTAEAAQEQSEAVAAPKMESSEAKVETPALQAEVSSPATSTPNTQHPAPTPAAAKAGSASTQTIRVDVTRLDKLLNLVGELVIDRTRIAQIGGQAGNPSQAGDSLEMLHETAAHIGRITDELQEEVMKARMLPIENVFNRFPRMIRDLAQKLGKEVNLEVEGKETELDRSVIEVIGDPLIHMLRNSVDHGIEMPDDRVTAGKPAVGTVWLRARHEESHIVIEIQDNGKGIDPEKLRANAVKKGLMSQDAANRLTDKEAIHLIFASGFSTADVISDVSGRGVGMDIVKSNLEKLGARIDIESKVGVGSLFTVKLPLTLAIIRGLLVSVNGGVYALPLASVAEALQVSEADLHRINHREVMLHRGRTLPLLRLSELFQTGMEAERVAQKELTLVETEWDGANVARTRQKVKTKPALLSVVVVGLADKQAGLVVDSLIGEQEVVIKTLGKFIGDIRGISGATILGDGRIALIVDVNGLIHIVLEEKGKACAA